MRKSNSLPRKNYERVSERLIPDDEKRNDIICPIHKKKYDYICKDCDKKLCPDCIFEQVTGKSKEHKDHQIDKIENPLEDALNRLIDAREMAEEVIDRYNAVNSTVRQTEKSIQNRDNEVRLEMHPIISSLQKKLDSDYQGMEDVGQQSAEKLNSQLLEIQKLLPDIADYLHLMIQHFLDQLKKCLKNSTIS